MPVNFRNALIISVAFHLSLIGPSLCNMQMPVISRPEVKPMVVDYVIFKEPERAVTTNIKVEPKGRPPVRIESHIPAVQRAIEARAQPAGKAGNGIVAEGAVNTKRSSVKKVDAPGEIPVREIIKKQDRVRSTKDFVDYFNSIRERIKQQLKTKYKHYLGEGDVHLVFVLNANGTLAGIEADKANSTQDPALITIAISSVRGASPFPSFPKPLALPQMYFNLVISFKK